MSDILDLGLCDGSGSCSATGIWQPEQFYCATNPGNLRLRDS